MKPTTTEYYAILDGPQGRVIGVCGQDKVDEIIKHEDNPIFVPLTTDEYLAHQQSHKLDRASLAHRACFRPVQVMRYELRQAGVVTPNGDCL